VRVKRIVLNAFKTGSIRQLAKRKKCRWQNYNIDKRHFLKKNFYRDGSSTASRNESWEINRDPS